MKKLNEKVMSKLEEIGLEVSVCSCMDDMHITFVKGDLHFSIYFENENDNLYSITISEIDENEKELFDKKYKTIRGLEQIKKYI